MRRLAEHGYREVVLTGVDITSYGADLPGTPRLGKLVRQILKHVPELEAPAHLVDRLGRGRRRPARRARRRAAADAASASLAPARRRPDPQAHEAPPLARRRDRVHRTGAPAAPRHRVRRRHHRGLPDRDRRRVRALARPRRRMRPHPSACVSLLRAARHAGRAHAAGAASRCARSARGCCARTARRRCAAISTARSARAAACSTESNGIGRTEQFTPVRLAAPTEPGMMLDLTIAGHDGRHLLAA